MHDTSPDLKLEALRCSSFIVFKHEDKQNQIKVSKLAPKIG